MVFFPIDFLLLLFYFPLSVNWLWSIFHHYNMFFKRKHSVHQVLDEFRLVDKRKDNISWQTFSTVSDIVRWFSFFSKCRKFSKGLLTIGKASILFVFLTGLFIRLQFIIDKIKQQFNLIFFFFLFYLDLFYLVCLTSSVFLINEIRKLIERLLSKKSPNIIKLTTDNQWMV